MNRDGVILNADDYAMTRGISEGILALAEAGRLSSTTAIVTTDHWPTDAKAAMRLRATFATGLHLNLTFGAPLGPMPRLAPDRILPSANSITRRALLGDLDRTEIAAEIRRQLDRFEEMAGFPPDLIDGHHHVHVLPGIRDVLLGVLEKRFPQEKPLIRDPYDSPLRILRRRIAAGKALTVCVLSAGFRRPANGAGFRTNEGFSGFSTFGPTPYADEFEAFLVEPGTRQMIMCHPGLPDDELGARDSIRDRRPEEHRMLASREGLPALIWRAERGADSAAFPW